MLDLIQNSVELQETALGLAVPETLAGLLHFFHQVLFMAEEGGDAEPEHVAEGLEGPGFVQERQVNSMELGMGTGFTVHEFLRKQRLVRRVGDEQQFPVFSFRLKASNYEADRDL